MIILKGAEVSAKIKEQVSEICGCMEGHIPTAALVRVGERPDDISYEKGAIKKIHSFGMEVRSYVFPEDIPEEDFMREFERINADDEIDGILLFKPFPQHLNEYRIEMMIWMGSARSIRQRCFPGSGMALPPVPQRQLSKCLRQMKSPSRDSMRSSSEEAWWWAVPFLCCF